MKIALKESKAAVEGEWAKYDENVKFKIAHAGNSKFLRAVDKAEAPYRRQIARNRLSSEKQLEIQCRAMSEGILLDWDGVESEDGPLDYSPENAYLALRYNSDLRDWVFNAATEQQTDIDEAQTTTAKKSRSS